MALITSQTSNFQVQYDPDDFGTQASLVAQRAQALLAGCEADYATLCDWFGALPQLT